MRSKGWMRTIHLLNDEKKFANFNKLIFPVVFLVLASQVFSIFTGKHLVNLFKLAKYQIKAHLSKQIGVASIEESRTLYCMFLIFYIVIIAFNYLYRKKSSFNRLYLLTILGVAYISSLMSATRGFFIAINFIFICALILSVVYQRKVSSFIGSVAVISGFIIMLTAVSPIVSKQIELAGKRYETLILLAEGDITAGGTLIRISKTMPRIMKYVNESPIFGYGFSSVYYKEGNDDVGFSMNLLNSGYVGTLFLYTIILGILFKIYKYSRLRAYRTCYQISGYFICFGLLAILIFHLTTNYAFGLEPCFGGGQHERYLIYALLLSFFNVTIINFNSINVKTGFATKNN